MHHTVAQTEQRRAELESLVCELRTAERRLEEVKRSAREMELLVEGRREDLRILAADTDLLKRSHSSAIKDEEVN
jgi:chaperonin cofactor prefoldin